MKILLINFSISNSGDYLIEKRMNALIKKTWPQASIDCLNGSREKISDKSQYDLILVGGGPYFDDRVINEMFIPLLSNVIDHSAIHIIGAGVYGNQIIDNGFYSRQFSSETKEFFAKISTHGGTFGCRDEISWRIMKNNGIENVYMTGCPAMFDFDYIDNSSVKPKNSIKKIVISDPGLTKKQDEQIPRAEQAIEIVNTIKTLFSESDIIFTFNNGINTRYSYQCNNIIKEHLERIGIDYYDMSGSESGFELYNNADIHIGFRVHSHIYSLSRRIPSVLIEEDLRGYGINETIGLPHLLAYDITAQNGFIPNPMLRRHLEDIIIYNIDSQFSRYEGAFVNMRNLYYDSYLNWANLIKENNR